MIDVPYSVYSVLKCEMELKYTDNWIPCDQIWIRLMVIIFSL